MTCFSSETRINNERCALVKFSPAKNRSAQTRLGSRLITYKQNTMSRTMSSIVGSCSALFAACTLRPQAAVSS
jgi:hypothetical protein